MIVMIAVVVMNESPLGMFSSPLLNVNISLLLLSGPPSVSFHQILLFLPLSASLPQPSTWDWWTVWDRDSVC